MFHLHTNKSIPFAVLPAVLLAGVSHISAQAAASMEGQPVVIVAKFDRTLDTKNAKEGDPISVKTLKAVKLADGTTLPKGSKLTAKVITVQSKKVGNGNSMLTFRFDDAQANGGSALQLHGQVVAIGPSLAPGDDLGPHSVMSRSSSVSSDPTNAGKGFGSTNGIDPGTGMGKAGAKDEDNIAMGSTLEGVALGVHKDADWTTALQGVKRDIHLDSDIIVKVQVK
jgi:hypothetical protein